jgi:HK97 family phage portal protein
MFAIATRFHKPAVNNRLTTMARAASILLSMGANELIVIRDYRSRAIPRDNPPNSNDPLGSVGPNVPAGFGDTHAMYPEGQLETSGAMPDVMAWQGWPTSWDTPNWNGQGAMPRLVSTLFTCIDLNTRQLASFPIYGVKGVQVVPLPDWSNNPEPELYSDWTEAAKQMFNTYQAQGEIVLWCTGRKRDGLGPNGIGSVARFVVLNPMLVNVEWSDGSIEYSLSGKKLDRADVCHIKYQTRPTNLRGIGPLEWVAQSVLSAAALEAMNKNLATRGGIPWAVLKSQRKLNGNESRDLQNAWIQGSMNRNGAPAVLSGSLDLATLSVSPREMMMLEQRVFDETRIAAAFGVPPYLVGLPSPDGLTYSNANSIFEFHWRMTLRTAAAAIASAMSNWLLPRGTRFEFNRDDYVKADDQTRALTDATLFNIVDEKGNRAKTVDEIRMGNRLLPNDPDSVVDMQGAIP